MGRWLNQGVPLSPLPPRSNNVLNRRHVLVPPFPLRFLFTRCSAKEVPKPLCVATIFPFPTPIFELVEGHAPQLMERLSDLFPRSSGLYGAFTFSSLTWSFMPSSCLLCVRIPIPWPDLRLYSQASTKGSVNLTIFSAIKARWPRPSSLSSPSPSNGAKFRLGRSLSRTPPLLGARQLVAGQPVFTAPTDRF